MVLFCSFGDHYFWQTKSEFSINRAECALVFIVMLNPFVIAVFPIAVVYGY